MKTPTVVSQPLIFSNDQELAGKLRLWFGTDFGKESKCCLICVSENCVEVKRYGIARSESGSIKRVLVIFLGRPIDLNAMGCWREWAVSSARALELRMDSLSEGAGESDFRAAVNRNCSAWFATKATQEKQGLELGQWVTMPKEKAAKDDPSLLTMMFGSMGELLTEVDVVARRFSDAVEKLSADANAVYRKKIDSLLKEGGSPDAKSGSSSRAGGRKPDDLLGFGNVTDQLPKLLLLGKSGVGKTLIAEYLHRRCGLDGRPLHISIPEYLGKEDMFEYTLFGYAAGNYTGGRKDGDHGLLIENLGGVVFLDEIGEANAAIQAKLLTFLDHYRVRPRGWLGDPFYCPVLVVAATNRDLDEPTDGKPGGKPLFRRDLLARFTDIRTIPLLCDRKQDFEFILDCLLQRQSMNPGHFVREIGAEALAFLKGKDYRDGNFRELEDLFRNACKKAHRDDRPYLTRADFE